jgi:hypothetical protein
MKIYIALPMYTCTEETLTMGIGVPHTEHTRKNKRKFVLDTKHNTDAQMHVDVYLSDSMLMQKCVHVITRTHVIIVRKEDGRSLMV